MAALATVAVIGTALALGLLFAAVLMGGLLLAGLWYSVRGRRLKVRSASGDRRDDSTVIDGEYTVVRDGARNERDDA